MDKKSNPNQIKIIKSQSTNPKKSRELVVDPKISSRKNAIRMFAENVSITGLKEAYTEDLKMVRYMFLISVITVLIMIVYESMMIEQQYQKQETIFSSAETLNRQAPFPNVTICLPMSVDEDGFRREMFIPTKARRLMQKHKISESDVIDFLKRSFRLNIDKNDMHTILFRITNAIADATRQSLLEKGQSFDQFFMSSCPKVLSNCAFDGRSFDCCRATRITSMTMSSCLQISLNKIAIWQNDSRIDPLQLKNTGLTFDANTDWTTGLYDAGSASDGYNIFIERVAHIFQIPIHVPTGMDVVVALAPPEKLTERTQCRPLSQSPPLKYFDYYDPHGVNCAYEVGLDMFNEYVGCVFSSSTYFPLNDSCTFGQMALIGMALSDVGFDNLKNSVNQKIVNEQMAKFTNLRESVVGNTRCPPLCSRWEYRTFSASYSALQYRNKDEEANQLSNRSWSRIRILTPPSYWNRKEEPRASPYLIMCDIGGMMGVYAGFSMITFAQILAYGSAIICAKRRSNRVSAVKMK